MAVTGVNTSRTTLMLSADNLLTVLRRTQKQLLKAQEQIATGLKVSKPSEAPASASTILLLQSRLEARDQYDRNLAHALSVLNNTDDALGQVSTMLLEAKSIALSQIGIGSNADTRAAQAQVIDAQLKALIELANRQVSGVSLFGGQHSAPEGKGVFVEFLGGLRYIGGTQSAVAEVGLREPIAVNSSGSEAFGALSTRVAGTVDLDPQAADYVHLRDIAGAQGQGWRAGSVQVVIDGNAVTVDLTTADTLGDVARRINDAIDSVDNTAGSLAISGGGFELTAAAGHTITISESGIGGQSAADLGIVLSATGATVAGGDVGTRLTLATRLADFGVPVDWLGGLKITQGATTKVADFSTAVTVQDLVNTVDRLGLGVSLEISADGSKLNLISQVSGLELSIGENAGGTTAGDLGLRSMGMGTLLADFNHGIGVSSVQGQDDFRFELHDGTTFNVNLDGITTVGELIAAIGAAAAGAGKTVGTPGSGGTDFNVGLAGDGNGFLFEDQTVGASDFRVVQLFTSLAATDLGIYKNAGSGGAITGDDVAKVRSNSVFTHLIMLRDALLRDDSRGIVFAGEGIERDIHTVARVRADVGVRAQRVQQQQERSGQLRVAETSLLGDLQGADLTEVITRFAQLQQQLQASLQVGASNLQQSFLDYLR